MASADISSATTLPNPVAGKCTSLSASNEAGAGQQGCWRYISFSEGLTPGPSAATLPTGSGATLTLTQPASPANEFLGNGAWWNTPIDIQGKAVEVSYTARVDAGDPIDHDFGVTFAMIEGSLLAGGPNIPAPVPFKPADRVSPENGGTDYGAGAAGMGFGGYKGNAGNDNG